MIRATVARAIAAQRGTAALITGPGVMAGYLYELADDDATIYNMEMGYASSVALGVAIARPDRAVLAVEGEGSFFAGSTALATIWRLQPSNLVVLVTDNGVWGTGNGTEPTATACGLDLYQLALADGWTADRVHAPSDPIELEQILRQALAGGGPHFVLCRIEAAPDDRSSPRRPRPQRHLLDCALLMRISLTGG